jgi:hypothetical protein
MPLKVLILALTLSRIFLALGSFWALATKPVKPASNTKSVNNFFIQKI